MNFFKYSRYEVMALVLSILGALLIQGPFWRCMLVSVLFFVAGQAQERFWASKRTIRQIKKGRRAKKSKKKGEVTLSDQMNRFL